MWDHVTLRATDLDASARFYDTVLRTLGVERTWTADWLVEWDAFSLSPANTEKPATRGLHIGFSARTREHVDAFWQAGVDAGYRDDGEPGLRPEYGSDYYGGFLLDPDGNSAEAVHHDDIADSDFIDHLWIRVADVSAAKAFYATIAPFTGAPLFNEPEGRAHFAGRGSFSVVDGTPTENLHMAFPAADRAGVEAFHRTAVAAGYTDNGAPGERPEYHPGYYGAFVLDPDGNNVEAVFHDRRTSTAAG
jgi:catechol 2,3-dioxygenase-like lactoylglutathione lyase family enzyme